MVAEDVVNFIIISLFVILMTARTKSQDVTWCHTILSILMIWMEMVVLFYMVPIRIITTEFEIKAKVMLITSGLGVLVNIVMGASILHQQGHRCQRGGRGHGHSHGDKEPHFNYDFLQSISGMRMHGNKYESLNNFWLNLSSSHSSSSYFKSEDAIIDHIFVSPP